MVLPGDAIVFDKQFEIISAIGRGRDTVVYHAQTTHTSSHNSTGSNSSTQNASLEAGVTTKQNAGSKKSVALKVLSGKKHADTLLNRLKQEATMLLLAEHPHVISLYGMQTLQDHTYLALEYAPYGDLLQYTKNGTALLGPEQSQLFFIECLEALAHLHKTGIIHRDIKPDNILVINEGCVKIGDFGVAITQNQLQQLHERNVVVGVMSYLAPEVLEGELCSHQSDLYALALTFYQIISGQHPFDNLTLIEQKALRESLNIPQLHELYPECPKKLSQVIMRMLSYDPRSRYSDASTIVKEFHDQKKVRSGKEIPSSVKEEPSRQNTNKVIHGRFAEGTATTQNKQQEISSERAAQLPQMAAMSTKPFSTLEKTTPGKNFTGQTNPNTIETQIMTRDFDKKKSDAMATQSIPTNMLNRFRMGELPASELEQPLNAKASKFTLPERGERAPKRIGFSRIILALFTCLAVAMGVIYIYAREQAIDITNQISRQIMGSFNAAAPEGKPATSNTAKKSSPQARKSTSFGFDSSDDAQEEAKQPNQKSKKSEAPSKKNIEDIAEDETALKSPPSKGVSPNPSENDTPNPFDEDEEIEDTTPQKKNSDTATENSEETEETEENDDTEPLPSRKSSSLTVKKRTAIQMQRGVYTGSVSNLFPQGTVHLSFIVLPDLKANLVMLGIDGWSPKKAEKLSEDGSLRVASNGIVLHFKGNLDGSSLSGIVEDMVTGQQGTWKVEATDATIASNEE
jgi:serine/threonine protein kinase